MDVKPADFFIGVADLFSIFLPGALLSYLLLDVARRDIIGQILPAIASEAANWMAFILAAYLFGHFASLIGAAFLDRIYDRTFVKYKRRHGDHLYHYACTIKADALGRDDKISNTYKWARAFIRLRSAESATEIERLEADSKFFRSVSVVLPVAAIVFAAKGGWIISLAAAAMTILSFWRFVDLRWKCTQATYLFLAMLQAQSAPNPD